MSITEIKHSLLLESGCKSTRILNTKQIKNKEYFKGKYREIGKGLTEKHIKGKLFLKKGHN